MARSIKKGPYVFYKLLAKVEKAKGRAAKNENDVFTALLGLSVLVLASTVAFVCLRTFELYDTIFKLPQ